MKNRHKFDKKYQKKSAQLNAAKARLEHQDREIAGAVEAAIKPYRELVSRLEGELDAVKTDRERVGIHAGEVVVNALETKTKLETTIEKLKKNHEVEVQALRRELDRVTDDRDMWQAKAEAAQPAVDAAEAKVRDLEAIIETIKDRAKRKELAKASAALNRQVVAGAVPGRRRW